MSDFSDWLRQCAAAGKGGVILRKARRGLKYTLTLRLAGDFTGATMTGQVRAAPDSASSLATFTCTNLGFADGFTGFTVVLNSGSGSNSTGSLPAAPAGDPYADFVFDLLLAPSGGDQELLLAGVLRLLGKVTA